MNCSCGCKLRVSDTRSDGRHTYRLRWCPKCSKEYTTQESIIDSCVGRQILNKLRYIQCVKKGENDGKS